MEDAATGDFSKSGQALADKAADKIQSGIRAARDNVKDSDDILSSKLTDVRSEAGTVINRGSKRVQSASQQGLDEITEMAGRAGDLASNAADSIVAYTKKNPVKALAIAAASGIIFFAIVRALTTSQD